MYCTKCGKEIPENAPNKYYYNKLCASCYEKKQAEVKQQTTRVRRKSNGVATALLVLAILTWVFGGVVGLILCAGDFAEIGVPVLIAGFVGGTFTYAFGEIIQLLEDIKNK